MAISIDWGNTDVIYVPQSYLTLVSGTLYSLDTETFRTDLKALESTEAGIAFPDTHVHNTEVTLAGITYARFIEIISPYTVEFEDGAYTVLLEGSNNNIGEPGIIVQNQVSVITQNSAGLIKGGLDVVLSSGQTAEQILISLSQSLNRMARAAGKLAPRQQYNSVLAASPVANPMSTASSTGIAGESGGGPADG